MSAQAILARQLGLPADATEAQVQAAVDALPAPSLPTTEVERLRDTVRMLESTMAIQGRKVLLLEGKLAQARAELAAIETVLGAVREGDDPKASLSRRVMDLRQDTVTLAQGLMAVKASHQALAMGKCPAATLAFQDPAQPMRCDRGVLHEGPHRDSAYNYSWGE